MSFCGENYRRLVLKFSKQTENERVDWKFMWIFTLSSNIAAPQPTIKKNPLLEALYSVLISQYSRKPESRSIIFVKTREIAKAVLTYINDAPGLSSFNLKSLPMTGTHAKSTQFGKNLVKNIHCFVFSALFKMYLLIAMFYFVSSVQHMPI